MIRILLRGAVIWRIMNGSAMRRARYAKVALCVAVFARAASAETPTDDAKAAFDRGASAYEAGQFAAAAREFARAYELRPHAAVAFNEARALERSGNAAQAADAYLLALERGELRPGDASEARARLDVLEQSLGRIELSGSPELRVSIGHLVSASLPLHAHLAPGRYELEVTRADGKRLTLAVPVSAGTLTRRALVGVGPSWDPVLPQTRRSAVTPSPSRFAHSLYFFGGAAVSAGLGVVLGAEALHAKTEFDASGQTDAKSHDHAVKLRTWANVAFGAAVGLGITGLVITWHDGSAKASTNSARLGVVGGGHGVGVAFAHAF